MAEEMCVYKWNGSEWILQGSVTVGDCTCAATVPLPAPLEPNVNPKVSIEPMCPLPFPPDADLAAGYEDPLIFAQIGGGEENHRLKKERFPKLSAEWELKVAKAMERAGIKVKEARD